MLSRKKSGLRGILKKKELKNMENRVYDMLIVGGGPGGYTAALYAARAGLSVAVLEKFSAGGQMALTHRIDNYPGFPEGIDGYELADRMQQQAESFGAETVYTEVTGLELAGDVKQVQTDSGLFLGRTVVIAAGANPRKMGLPGEEELTGRGVHYCAHCDGMFYKGKTVVVVGGGNSAAADAMILSRIAEKVILIHRRDSLRATKIYHEPLMNAPNVEFFWESQVTQLLQEEGFRGIRVKNLQSGEEQDILCDGLFVSIGRVPAGGMAQGQLEMDGSGYILADESTRTSVPGVFAVGDVRTKALRQVVTAVADGAVAAHYAEEYLL